MVGAPVVLQPTPAMIERVERGTLSRQPEQADARLLAMFRQAQAAGMAVAAAALQEQPERPAGTSPMDAANAKSRGSHPTVGDG